MIEMDPDSEFDFGISDDEILRRFKEAIRIDTERRNVLGVPTAHYDVEKTKSIMNTQMGDASTWINLGYIGFSRYNTSRRVSATVAWYGFRAATQSILKDHQ